MSNNKQPKTFEDYTPKQRKIMKIILWGFLGFVTLFILIGIFAEDSSSNSTDTKTDSNKAAFTAELLDTEVVDPATLQVFYEVKNTGNKTAKADCSINAKNANGTYRGFDVFSAGEINPGKSETIKSSLTITKEGASYVTDVTIECS